MIVAPRTVPVSQKIPLQNLMCPLFAFSKNNWDPIMGTIMSNGSCRNYFGFETPPRWVWSASIVLAVVFATTAAFTNRAASDRTRALALADTLLTVPAAGVPFALENLRPIQHLASARLQNKVMTSPRNSVECLRAAFGLIESDHRIESLLLDAIATAPASECRNLITALSHVKSTAVPALVLKAQAADNPTLRARYTILALHLGDAGPAESMLHGHQAPADRSSFIHNYAAWHGDPDDVAKLLLTHDDPAFRSGLCSALGTVDHAERGLTQEVLSKLYCDAPDGGTHSAAGWALREWNLPMPTAKSTSHPPAGRGWFLNGLGITMVEVPAGQFQMGTAGEAPFEDECPAHDVRITRAFFLADREVTVNQFLRFVSDTEYPPHEKPRDWQGLSHANSPSGDCPVQLVTWFDAILFCNWLSAREGRQPCYQRLGTQIAKNYDGQQEEHDLWNCDFSCDGYRLPTEAEWEYAARAGSSASYCFGEETLQLPQYAWFRNNSGMRTWPGGQKRPNTWGVFDTHGNVAEWCWDFESPYSADSVSDPKGPKLGSTRVLRGGAAGAGDLGCRSAFRDGHHPAFRSAWTGFRVCYGISEVK